MTALYFHWLRAGDRVSVKPHASPVLHAVNYLLGRLDRVAARTAARLRRPAGVPEPHEGSRPDRLLDRLGRPRRRGAAVRRRRRPLRALALRHARGPPVRGADRRRRAGRGQRLGGDRRPVVPRPRQRHVDRRLQPPVARPRHPGRPRSGEFTNVFREHGWHVEILKYGPQAAGRVRSCPAATRCAGASTTCRTRSTRACCAGPASQLRSLVVDGAPARRPRRAGARARALLRRGAARPDRQPGRPRPRRRARRARPAATPSGSARASSSRSPSRASACPSPGHPMNHSAVLSRRPDRRAAPGARRPAPTSGPASIRHARRRRLHRRDGAPDRAGEPAARDARRRRGADRVRPDADRATRPSQEAFARALVDLVPLRRRRQAPGHDVARRVDLDRPRRLDQQARRVRPDGRGGVRVRRGVAAALDAGPRRPAHRARHLAR